MSRFRPESFAEAALYTSQRRQGKPQKARRPLKRGTASLSRGNGLKSPKKKKAKRAKLPSIKSLHKRAWAQFSIWVRTQNADSDGYVQCTTCPARHLWNSGLIHAGHWIHGRLDFNPRNVHPQCRNDNFFTNTRVNTAYSCFMARTYGSEVMDELRLLSNTKLNKYTREELNELIAHYGQINSNHPLLQEVK